jgi:hypothetical protein
MPRISKERTFGLGFEHPASGVSTLGVLLLAFGLGGCGDNEMSRILKPNQVAMTKEVAPIYDDGELTLYEVKRGIEFPILAPTASQMGALGEEVIEPYGRRPWITSDEVRVQLTWTLSNLDEEPHNVELLVDPWNEFGRYWPGLTLVDADNGEYQPNFSGIDYYYSLEGKGAGEASRRHGTYTFDDMDELARDFATVLNLIKFPPGEGLGVPGYDGDLLPVYVNHAFNFQNRSDRDPLVQGYVPQVIAGLTGVDIGLRTYEPATIAVEVVVELVDTTDNTNRVREDGSDAAVLPAQETIVTVGVAP